MNLFAIIGLALILVVTIGGALIAYFVSADKEFNKTFYNWYEKALIDLQEDKIYNEDKRFKKDIDLLEYILRVVEDKELRKLVLNLLDEYKEYIKS